MIRSTRAVCKRISIDYAEMSDDDCVVKTDTKMSKKKKKMLFLKNLDSQVEASKKKIKREQDYYIKTITDMYNTLIGKIPKAIQDTPVDQFIAIDGQLEERTETDAIQIVSRPSEIVDFPSMPKKRLMKGKTPAKPEIPPPNDDVVYTNTLLISKEKISSKLKKKKTSSSSSTKSNVKQAPRARRESPWTTPMESTRPKRMLRSTLRNSTLSTVKSSKSKAHSIQKSTTPFLCGTAPATKKSNMARNSSMANANAQHSTVGRKRSSTQRAVHSKVRKVEATPLRQQSQPNAGQFTLGSQHSRLKKSKRESPDENTAPSFESITLLTGGSAMRPCRPGEKVLRLPDSACPLINSQPTIICPLEDGNALTISCDTDFTNLTLPKGVMENLKSFQKKLRDFLKMSSLTDE